MEKRLDIQQNEFAVLLRDSADLKVFGQKLAEAINPVFFDEPNSSDDIVSVSVNGSQNAGKSMIPDYFAMHVLPGSENDHYLSYYGDDENGGEYSELVGNSPLYGGAPVLLSFQETEPDAIDDRNNAPGVHFFQNTRESELPHHWMSIDVRAPEPEDEDDYSEVLIDIETFLEDDDYVERADPAHIRNLIEDRENFSYINAELLQNRNLSDVFRDVSQQEHTNPRVLVFNVHDDRLLNDPQFQRFLDMMADMEANPEQASDILRSRRLTGDDSAPDVDFGQHHE